MTFQVIFKNYLDTLMTQEIAVLFMIPSGPTASVFPNNLALVLSLIMYT